MTTAVWQFIKDHNMGPTPLDDLDPPEPTVVDGLTILASRKPIPSTVRVPETIKANFARQVRKGRLKKTLKASRELPIDSLGPLVARRTRRRTK
jgi:hypothetical protein